MTLDWYGHWLFQHAKTFGINAEADLAAMESWREYLSSTHTAEVLHAASSHMMRHVSEFGRVAESTTKQLGKMSGHLAAVEAAIREVLAVEYRQHAATVDRGECTMCKGTGQVVVPMLASIRDGEWRPIRLARSGASYYTSAVWCRCPLGQWKKDRYLSTPARRGRDRVPVLSLDEYQLQNERWRVQMEQRRQQIVKAAATVPKSADDKLDTVFGHDDEKRSPHGPTSKVEAATEARDAR